MLLGLCNRYIFNAKHSTDRQYVQSGYLKHPDHLSGRSKIIQKHQLQQKHIKINTGNPLIYSNFIISANVDSCGRNHKYFRYISACSVYSRLKVQFCSAIEELVQIIPMPGTSVARENIFCDIDNLLKQYGFPLTQLVCALWQIELLL